MMGWLLVQEADRRQGNGNVQITWFSYNELGLRRPTPRGGVVKARWSERNHVCASGESLNVGKHDDCSGRRLEGQPVVTKIVIME